MTSAFWIPLPAALVTLLLAACGSAPPVAPVPAPEVSISRPLTEPVEDALEWTGRTAAVEEVEVRARVSGYIEKVHFVEGTMVRAGDLLFEIDPREYRAAVLRSEGEVARLRALLARAEAEVARTQRLRPAGAASEREVETAIAQKGAAEGELKAALAQLEQARLDLEFTRVTAAIAGRVSRAEITAGNLVVVGPQGGPLLTTIVRQDPMYVYFDVDERSLLQFRQARLGQRGEAVPPDVRSANAPVRIGLANEEGFPHAGTIDFIDNRVDPATGTIRVRGVFANADGLLAPGLFVRVRLPLGPPRPAVLVTERAIGTDQDRKFVLVVNAQNVVEYRPVTLGARHGSLRVVLSGLGAEDWVVVNGVQRARPGVTVTPQRVAMQPAAPPPVS